MDFKSDEYKFECLTAERVGDVYRYTIQANSYEEAQEKLFRFFFEDKSGLIPDVEQQHGTITYPYYSVCQGTGVFGDRFARLVSSQGTEKDYQWKQKYAFEHGIKLRE